MTHASAAVSLRAAPAAAHPVIGPAGWPPVPAQATPGRRPASPAPAPTAPGLLPPADNVLAVITRPGQESADLGGLLYAFRRAGARLALLSVTRGEASPLNSTCERLETLRPWELQVAAGLLGISSLTVADYPDGDLSRYPIEELTERVQRQIRTHAADLLLLVDPAAGSPDDAVLAKAACSAAAQAGIPAVARTAPSTRSGWLIDLGAETTAARATQRSAAAAHTSQSEALPELQHRLELLGGNEQLRWLIPPDPTPKRHQPVLALAEPLRPETAGGRYGSTRLREFPLPIPT
jgi:LmbE family N-acetylglucosaminyl deacetylase